MITSESVIRLKKFPLVSQYDLNHLTEKAEAEVMIKIKRDYCMPFREGMRNNYIASQVSRGGTIKP